MSEQRVFYMHTIEGKPAGFSDEQICYAAGGRGWRAPLAPDLKTIRAQQKASAAFRRLQGWEVPTYGYVRVRLP